MSKHSHLTKIAEEETYKFCIHRQRNEREPDHHNDQPKHRPIAGGPRENGYLQEDKVCP